MVSALLVLVLAECVVGQPWKAMLSPGPIAKSHENVEGDCDSCHLVFKGVPDEKCLKCHTGLKAMTFHQVAAKTDPCIRCHVDHRGADAKLTTNEALAGFDHKKARFPLGGSHEKIECAKCHDKPLEKMAPNCGGCHRDPHEKKLGANCERCHSSDRWKAVRSKDEHDVAMEGGHEKLGCTDCHANGRHLEEQVACASCHEQEHGGTKSDCTKCHQVTGWKPAAFNHDGCTCKFPGKHRTFSCLGCHADFKFTATPQKCSGCHAKEIKHDPLGECSLCHSALSWKKKDLFDHNKRSKFPIENEHLEVDCSRCHPLAQKTKLPKFRGVPSECSGCHLEDGVNEHGDFGACEKCHTTKGFDQPTFDHASTGFPLDGKHKKIECQDCHATKVKRVSVDRPFGAIALLVATHEGGSSKACGNCHEDPHKDPAADACEGCHNTEVWRPSTFTLERHEATKLPLKHKHREVECSSCHVSAQLRGLPVDCANCHFDVHGTKLGKDCATCHSEQGFKPASNFDHKVTGFVLEGQHLKLECAKCHGDEKAKAEDLTKRKDPRACATCHAPNHGKDVGEKCDDCHLTRDLHFADARGRFDHDVTSFSLERRHRVLGCKQCHQIDRTRAPSSRCSGCHLDPHMGQSSQSCEKCHRPDRWRLARFDHDLAGWPLRGRHFVTPCANCHFNQRWVGLPKECFDCHMQDAARGQAVAPNLHAFGMIRCGDCHANPWRWRM